MIFVGDIHGDINAMKRIMDIAMDETVVFVGDFLDSFTFNIREQLECIDYAIYLAETNQAIVLQGNHELSYISPDRFRCGGHNGVTQALINTENRVSRMERYFKKYFYVKEHNLLATHAGLSNTLVKQYKLDTTDIKGMIERLLILPTDECPLYNIGISRWGHDKCGGIFWSDWVNDHKPVPDLIQIVGHTPRINIENKGTDYCVDCLQSKYEYLHYNENTKIFTVHKFSLV